MTVCIFIASALLLTGSSTASSLGQALREEEMRPVKLLKFIYLIFLIGLSSCCIYSRVFMVRDKTLGDFRSTAVVHLSPLLEVPTLSVCQMALLYLCQWHTFWGLWCVSISPLYSGSIWRSITAGYFRKCWSSQRAVPIRVAITVPEEHSRHYPQALCPLYCSCWPLTQARLIA